MRVNATDNAGNPCLATQCFSVDEALRNLARGNYEVWSLGRSNSTGIYLDNLDLRSLDKRPWASFGCSSMTGLGVLFECVADAMGWRPRVEIQRRVTQSLLALNNKLPGVVIPRNQQGMFPHFFDAETGAAKNPSFGLMNTGLMAAGALFARKYFETHDPGSKATQAISQLASELYNSVQWDSILCNKQGDIDPTADGIPMVQGVNATCTGSQFPQKDGLYGFNEEHYTVDFAYHSACAASVARGEPCPNAAIANMWKNWQGRRLHTNRVYDGHKLLSMWSGYIVHLPFYTVRTFNSDATYRQLLRSHWEADWDYYNKTAFAGQRGRYGLGAGPSPPWCTDGDGYVADRINQGTSFCRIYSPYITAGYLPVAEDLITSQLVDLMADGETVVEVPGTGYRILWRKAMLDPGWSSHITLVDLSSELFGLSTVWLTEEFYQNNTDHWPAEPAADGARPATGELRQPAAVGLAAAPEHWQVNATGAGRICRPPPPRPAASADGRPTCLVVGDSVSLGYTTPLTGLLNQTCDVLHAPFSGDGGACDTRYGLQCGPMWLGTSLDGNPAPAYDVVVFNFGLHDTNDEAKDEEARDEFVPLQEYGKNLQRFLGLIRTLQPAARVGWVASTPMHFDMHLNDNVIAYNKLAAEQLVAPHAVDGSLDLYSTIVGACGSPPYYGSKAAPNASHHCDLINDNEEYHYNTRGWALLAENVASFVKELLRRNVSASLGKSHVSTDAPAELCPDRRTTCPASSTCVADSYSDTKWGCCLLPAAVDCGDSWHCCPHGTACQANGTYNHICTSRPSPQLL